MEGKGNQKQQNKPKQNQSKQQQPNQNKKGGQKGKGPANQNAGSVKQEKAETAVQPGTDSALPAGIVEGLPTQQSSTLETPVTAQPIKEQVSETSATPSPKIEVSEPAATPQASPSGKEGDAQSKPAKQGKSSGKGGGAGGQKAAGNAQPKNAKASQPSSNPQAAKTASVEQAQKTSDTTSDNEKTKERSPAVSTLSPEQGSKKESSRTPSPNKSAQNQSKKGGKNANAPQPSSNPQAAKTAGVGEAHKISDTTSDNKKTKEQSPAVSTLSPEQGSKKELNRAPSPNKGAQNQSKKGGKNANAPQPPSDPQEAKTVAVEEAQKISDTISDNKKTQEQSPAGSTLSPEEGSKKESSRTPSPNKGALNQSKKGGKNTNAPQPSSNPQAAKAAGVEQAQKISDTTSDDKKSQEQSPAVSTLSPEQGSKKGPSRTPSPNKGAQNQSKKGGKNANKDNANADKEAEPQPSGQVESKPESSVKSDKDESEIKINQDSNKTTANSGPASKGGKNASKANKPQNTKDKTDGKVSEQPTSKKPSPSADKPKGTGAAQVPVVSNVTQSDKEDASPTKSAVDPPLVIMPTSQKGEAPSATSGPAPLTLDVKLVSPTEDSTPESPQSSGKKKQQKKGQQQPKSNEASPPCQKPSVTVAETTPSNKQAKQSPSSAEQSPPAVKQSSSSDKQSSPLVKPSTPVEQGKPSAKEIPPNVEQTSLSSKQSTATVKKSPPPVETTAKQAQPGVKKGSPVGQSQPSVQTIPVEQAVSNVKSTQPAKQSSPKPSSAPVKQSPVVAKSSPPVDQSSSAGFEPLLSDLSFSRVTQPILVAAKELEKSPNLEAPDFEPLLTDITVTMGGVACPHVDKIPSGTTAPPNLETASSKTQPDKEPKKVTPKSDSAPISGSPLKCDAPPFYPSGESPSLPAQLTMPSPEQMSSANKKSSPPKQISPENKPKNNEKSNPKAGGTAKNQPTKKEDAPLTTKIDDIANMTSPSAVVEVSNRLNAVEKENAELRIRIGDLTALLSKLEVRVNVLEKAAGTSSTVALQTSANNTHAASQAVINNANVGSQATAAVKTAGSQSKPTPKKDDDDDGVDLFASDSEEEDAEASKIREQRLAEYAAKKSKKPALIAKSSIILDVKPWDDETDMKAMEEQVRKIAADGLLWGASKLVPLAYGIHKLQINCVVEDDKISIDWLQETIEEIEDYVQSVDIAAFNKI